MALHIPFLKCTVASLLSTIVLGALLAGPGWAVNEARLDDLYMQLKDAERAEALRLAREIDRELANSGSPAMNLLLKRGRDALEEGDYVKAIEHLTALTDHAPEFAQGFHLRATAYYNVDKYGPALADLERALALEPRHFGAMSGRAVIFEELGMPEEALEVYYEVRDIHPNRENLTQTIERLEKATAGLRL